MNSSASPGAPTPAGPPLMPPGFWGVLRIIATRLPEQQLFWLAVLLCGFMLLVLGLGAWQLHNLALPVESPHLHPQRGAPAELLSAMAPRAGLLVLDTAHIAAHASRSCCCWQWKHWVRPSRPE